MRFVALFAALLGMGAAPVSAQTRASDKLTDDPTKVVTKLSLRYSDFGTVAGSLAFGPVTKINVSVSEYEQWSFGGSYLFDFGIVNVSASRRVLSRGIRQTQYSIGTFVPLSALGIQPGRWQLFPMLGANYTEGQGLSFDFDAGQIIPVEVSSKGGYAGIFALNPISPDWTFKSAVIGSAGSGDYTGITVGGGLTYSVTRQDSLSVFGSYIDNSFGSRELLGISYTREF